MVALELLAAFVLIVGGAIGFTNAVEWLGHRLDLGQGAVGALLAAVGTALPESVIPVVALLSGGGSGEAVQVAIGAIIGAPFVLGTLAMLVIAGSALAFRGRRDQGTGPRDRRCARRAATSPCSSRSSRSACSSARWTRRRPSSSRRPALLRRGLRRLHVADGPARRRGLRGRRARAAVLRHVSKDDPPSTLQIVLQFVVSLAAIVGGAELFVERDREHRGVDRRRAAGALARAGAARHRAAREGELDPVGARRQGHAGGRQRHRRDGVPGHDPGRLRPRGDALGSRAGGDRRRRDRARRAARSRCYVLPGRSVGLLPTIAWAAMFAGFVVFLAVG